MNLLKLQSSLATLSRWTETALIVACGVLLCVMAGSVFFEVLIRHVIQAPTAWTEELAQFALVWYGLLAAAVGARKGLHFSIRWGVIGFNERTRWAIRQFVNAAVIVFLVFLVKEGLAYLDIVADQTSTGAGINMRWPWAGIPVGLGAMLLIYVLEMADAVLSLHTGQSFSVKEQREAEVYQSLKSDADVPPPAAIPLTLD